MPPLRIAIFHDSYAQNGGAERVSEAIHRFIPEADMYTTLSVPERLSSYLRGVKIRNTWMQALPAKAKLFRHYFLLYPFAVEGVDLTAYDLVITSCIGYAKGVKRRAGAVHICYCHTPMRWVWRTADYLMREDMSRLKKLVIGVLLKPLKAWEIRAARRPDIYIANSHVVAQRIKDAFNIESEVIPPPIETDRFAISSELDDSYLILARLTPYKRIDLAVQACTQLGLKLNIIGAGPDRARLESLAGPTITFLGRQPDDAVNRYAARCKALLFPGEEDFGIVPLEINAAGRPVIAFYGGGATETVIEGQTGVFFHESSVESLADAITRFESITWDPVVIRNHAKKYDTHIFRQRMQDAIHRACPAYRATVNQ